MPSSINKLRIGILGGRGMLGSDLVEFLGERHKTSAIGRENYEEFRGAEFDVLINANGQSRRFWANRNPLADFEASTISVYRSLFDFSFGKYIYISSSDVYENHSSPETTSEDRPIDPAALQPYGFHKYLSEQIVRNKASDWVILRCSMILGRNLKKGPVYDILQNKPLFVSRDSRLQMITTRGIAEIIEEILRRDIRNEIYNVGGIGTVDFREAEKYFPGRKIEISEGAERQIYEMNISKVASFYPLETSEEYLKQCLKQFL